MQNYDRTTYDIKSYDKTSASPKESKMVAKQYMYNVASSLSYKDMFSEESIYYGVEGHKRLAREVGYALNDFDEVGQREIIQGSYSVIYVIACDLRPLLDASQWISILREQVKE